MDAPQVVVGELLRGRHLERRDRRPLRVEGAGDDPDRAVLAGRVDALEDDEDGVLGFRLDPRLEVGQAREHRGQVGLRLRLLAAERRAAVEVGQVDLRAGLDPQELPEAPVRPCRRSSRPPARRIRHAPCAATRPAGRNCRSTPVPPVGSTGRPAIPGAIVWQPPVRPAEETPIMATAPAVAPRMVVPTRSSSPGAGWTLPTRCHREPGPSRASRPA